MTNADTQAIPFLTSDGIHHSGVTKREYFTGLAMLGLLTASTDGEWTGIDAAAKQAVIEADALLKELEQ